MKKVHRLELLRRAVNRNSMLYKILTSYVIIVVLGFTLFAAVLANAFMRNAEHEMQNTTNTMVMQSYNTADVLLKHNFTYYYDLFFEDSDMIRGLYTGDLSAKEDVEIYTYLQKAADNDVITDSIYLYNGTAGKIYSSIPGVYTLDSFYDRQITDMMKNQAEEKKGVYEPRVIRLSISGRQKETPVITYILSEDLDRGEEAHALIVNIDQSTLQQMITGPLDEISVRTFIINQQRMVMSASDDDILLTTLEDEYMDTLLASSADSGEIKLKDYYIAYQKSDMLNWYFIGMADYDDILFGFRHIYVIILIAVSFFVLLGLLAASISTKRIYMPMYTLLKDLRQKVDTDSHEENQAELSEYEYLNSTFNNLLGNMEQLKDQLQTSNQNRRNMLLLEILNGEYVKKNCRDVWKEYNICVDAPFFQVLCFQMDGFPQLRTKYSAKDIDLFKFAICNVADETLSAYYQVDSVADGDDHIAMILQKQKNTPLSVNALKEHLKEVKDNLSKAVPWCTISISIGPVVDDYTNIPDSYVKARSIMSFRLFYGKSAEIVYDEIPEIDRNADYPVEEEKELIAAIRQKSEKRVDTAISSLFDAFRQHNPDEVPMMINQVVLNIVQDVVKAGGGRSSEGAIDWRTEIDLLNHLDTLEEIQAETEKFVRSLGPFQSTASSMDKKNEVVEKIKAYVAEHYSDRDLSVECLADHVGLSTNYVRQIFKASMDQSLSEYILNTRMEKAQQLMLTTDHTAKSIAAMVGYADSRYFYVVFKRYTGMTAEEFRRQKK